MAQGVMRTLMKEKKPKRGYKRKGNPTGLLERGPDVEHGGSDMRVAVTRGRRCARLGTYARL